MPQVWEYLTRWRVPISIRLAFQGPCVIHFVLYINVSQANWIKAREHE